MPEEETDESPLTVECPRCGGPIEEDEVRKMWGQVTRARAIYHAMEKQTPCIAPCCDAELTQDEVKTLWGGLTSMQRKTRRAGPGRPRSKRRCPCGQMTRRRAKLRNHKCEKPQ